MLKYLPQPAQQRPRFSAERDVFLHARNRHLVSRTCQYCGSGDDHMLITSRSSRTVFKPHITLVRLANMRAVFASFRPSTLESREGE